MGAKRLYNEMDIMLSLGIILTNTRKGDDTKRKVARLMKNVPRRLKPTLGLIMKSKDPLKVIEDALDRWEPAYVSEPPTNTDSGEPASLRPSEQDDPRPAKCAESGVAVHGPVANVRKTPGRDPKTGRFIKAT